MSTPEHKNANLGDQAIALAEQLGRIAGTIQGTAESWIDRQQLAAQLTRVRDGATQMLEALNEAAARGRKAMKSKTAKPATAPRTVKASDRAKAPGKKRRGPAPTIKGAKKSDERIPKLKTAAAARQRRKSYA